MDPVYFNNAVSQVQKATAIYAQALDDFIVAMQNLKSQVQDNPAMNYTIQGSASTQWTLPEVNPQHVEEVTVNHA